MLGFLAQAVNQAPARVAYSVSVVVRSVFAAAAVVGAGAVTLATGNLATQVAPVVLAGEPVDAGAIVMQQLQGMTHVLVMLGAVAHDVLAFVGLA